jgi:hypothetical protein
MKNNTVKSGKVSIEKTKVFEYFEYFDYVIETSACTLVITEQDLEDLEKCLWKLKGWEIMHQSPTQVFIKKLPSIKEVKKALKKEGVIIKKPKK